MSRLEADFLSGLLQEQPEKRFSAQEALAHPWLSANETTKVCQSSLELIIGRPAILRIQDQDLIREEQSIANVAEKSGSELKNICQSRRAELKFQSNSDSPQIGRPQNEVSQRKIASLSRDAEESKRICLQQEVSSHSIKMSVIKNDLDEDYASDISSDSLFSVPNDTDRICFIQRTPQIKQSVANGELLTAVGGMIDLNQARTRRVFE